MFRTAGLALIALVAAVGHTRAEDVSRDRAEFDAAAGRAVPTVQEVTRGGAEGSRPVRQTREGGPRGDPAPRAASRPVRVILSSPYGQ